MLHLSPELPGMLHSALLANPCEPGQDVCNQVYDWTTSDSTAEFAQTFIGTPASLLLIVIIGLVARWLLHRLVDRLVKRAEEGVLPDRLNKMTVGRSTAETGESARSRRMQRARTMGDLLKSIITGVIVAVVITMMLAELSYDIGPILASAGILGVALGFGAQNLVRDFLSGIFMIFEDQLGVGDVVDLGPAAGTVEAVSLRVTRLRDVNGTVWYVRNGEILRVGNQSQNWARTVLDVTFPYREDVARVRRVLAEVARDLWRDDDFGSVIIEEPEVWGVENVTADEITMRVTLKTAPLEQWRVAREMRARIKARFDAEGIGAPDAENVVVNQSQAAQEAAEEA
jgi:moderate conductance mechanosensitive channel